MELVFDLDGVLLDSERRLDWLERALSETLATFDLPDTAANRARIGPGQLHRFRRTAREFGVDPAAFWRVRNRRYTAAKLAAMDRHDIGPFPDVPLLGCLAEDHSVSILSNSPQEVVDAFMADLEGVIPFRTGIGRGSDLEALASLKPHPHMAERLRAATVENTFCYVGDRESDRAFAANAGMEYVHLVRPDGDPGDLGSLATRLRRC